jgi:hypothetical protein
VSLARPVLQARGRLRRQSSHGRPGGDTLPRRTTCHGFQPSDLHHAIPVRRVDCERAIYSPCPAAASSGARAKKLEGPPESQAASARSGLRSGTAVGGPLLVRVAARRFEVKGPGPPKAAFSPLSAM